MAASTRSATLPMEFRLSGVGAPPIVVNLSTPPDLSWAASYHRYPRQLVSRLLSEYVMGTPARTIASRRYSTPPTASSAKTSQRPHPQQHSVTSYELNTLRSNSFCDCVQALPCDIH